MQKLLGHSISTIFQMHGIIVPEEELPLELLIPEFPQIKHY